MLGVDCLHLCKEVTKVSVSRDALERIAQTLLVAVTAKRAELAYCVVSRKAGIVDKRIHDGLPRLEIRSSRSAESLCKLLLSLIHI